ncbi:MAG: response regulator [Tepidisphaeraceae bacterium]|jgi:PAS domain S-box-containing protein
MMALLWVFIGLSLALLIVWQIDRLRQARRWSLALVAEIGKHRAANASLEEREQHYRELISGLPQLLWTSKPDGQFDFLNSWWTQYTGVAADQQLGSGWLEQVHPDDREQFAASWRAALAVGAPMAAEARIRRKDGDYRWFDVRATPLRDATGKVIRWFGSNLDIEDRRRAEEALRETEAALRAANDTLERRVQDRTAELESQSERLRALALDLAETESRERKRLAQVLHDHFQQLISAAKMKIGIIRRRSPDHPDLESLRQTESLLEEVLATSRDMAMELSPPVLHDAGLAAAFEWLARRMEKNHHLVVRVRLEKWREPDNEQVRTVVFECVRELLFNVVKHSGAKLADLTATVVQDGLLQIRVIDAGKGFEAQRMDLKRKPDGSFGLFSIRERLGLIGGLVKATSSPGCGTMIEVTLPVTFSPLAERRDLTPLAPVSAQADSGPERIVRVLVADDHKLFREGLISLLNQERYLNIVGEAGDGEEAVELARRLRPDIMIMDVTMPKLNGIQATAMLTKELPNVKIIGLSMHERDDMATAMRDAGAVAYCAKSAPIESLVAILRNTAAASEASMPAD